jgi:hypothetical protein
MIKHLPGYVDGFGVYHPAEKVQSLVAEASQYKSWRHDRQRADRQWELIQPWTRDGRPSKAFMEAYPDESKVNGMDWKDAR